MWWEEALFYLLAGKRIKDNLDSSGGKLDIPENFLIAIAIVIVIATIYIVWDYHRTTKKK